MALINDTRRLRDLDPAFLEKYNLVGPRYTSYPTAPEWKETVDSAAVRAHLDALRDAGNKEVIEEGGESKGDSLRPLSIYMHLPFCIEHCTFCACNVIISSKMEAVSDPYLEVLDREVAMYAEHVDTRRPVMQFHWGGGTPTYLTPAQLRRVHGMVSQRFNIAPQAEQSIEVHVTWTSDAHMLALASLGFNRISMGVQDFNEKTQEAIHRRQTFARTKKIVEMARALGFRGINFDLVYGLPYQTPETFGDTVDKVLELRPDRLAVYNFAFLPEVLPHQRAITRDMLPSTEQKFQSFLEAHDRFVAAGYRYIGMDHFAIPEDELAIAFDKGTMQRNFMGFTTHAGADLLGMGVSAISSATNMFAQNVKKLPHYERAVGSGEFPTERGLILSSDDLVRREIIGQLMCRDHVSKRELESKYKIVFDEYFADELAILEPLVRDELLTVSPDSLDLTFLGRLFVRNIAMVFDAYIKREGGKKLFSRTL